MSDDDIEAMAEHSRWYWLTYRGCPIVYGRAPGFRAPEGPCWYCHKDHHHAKEPRP